MRDSIIKVTSANIYGKVMVGETLVAEANTGARNLTYQWQICDTADGQYTNIDGAKNSRLLLTEDQKDKFIKVIISGNNGSSKTSEPTIAVSRRVVKVTKATIEGIAKVGETLTAITDEGATNVTYQWVRKNDPKIEGIDHTPIQITGETGKTLTITPDLVGKVITVEIRGEAGTPEKSIKISAATDVVVEK